MPFINGTSREIIPRGLRPPGRHSFVFENNFFGRRGGKRDERRGGLEALQCKLKKGLWPPSNPPPLPQNPALRHSRC